MLSYEFSSLVASYNGFVVALKIFILVPSSGFSSLEGEVILLEYSLNFLVSVQLVGTPNIRGKIGLGYWGFIICFCSPKNLYE